MADQDAVRPDQIDLLQAVLRHHVLRYPSGETHRYFDDGTYTASIGDQVEELVEAGTLVVGAQHTPTVSRSRWYREIELTKVGQQRLAQALHEQAQAADPQHDLSSCACCCLTCSPDD